MYLKCQRKLHYIQLRKCIYNNIDLNTLLRLLKKRLQVVSYLFTPYFMGDLIRDISWAWRLIQNNLEIQDKFCYQNIIVKTYIDLSGSQPLG